MQTQPLHRWSAFVSVTVSQSFQDLMHRTMEEEKVRCNPTTTERVKVGNFTSGQTPYILL